ncbi:MAG TPA: DinB family protein [Terriglobales bacterium]|nr:DinB family protein [Terriglobales bacterium]
MSIGQSLLPEFDEEMKNTRKVLERVPDKKWNWKPHEKSGTLGWLAGHVGTVPEWLTMTMTSESLDYAPVDGPSYQPPKIENRAQLLVAFDKAVAEARAALIAGSDADFQKEWTLLAGGQKIFSLPRVACIRSMILNHLIHHRGQLTVYFRLVGVPVPGLYGPSADEAQPDASSASAGS